MRLAVKYGRACVKLSCQALAAILFPHLLLGLTFFQSPHLYIHLPVRSAGSDTDDLCGSGAYAFVVQHSPSGDDGLLPGLCMLAERWLKKVCHTVTPSCERGREGAGH